MTEDCRNKIKCQVNGRGKKHHTMLHVIKKKSNNNSPLLAIPQSLLKRLGRVQSLELERLERAPSAGMGTLFGVIHRLAIVPVVVN